MVGLVEEASGISKVRYTVLKTIDVFMCLFALALLKKIKVFELRLEVTCRFVGVSQFEK